MKILLMDRTTRKNIIWATDDYASLGEQYAADREIIFGLSEVMASLVLAAFCSSHSTCTSKSLSNFWGAYQTTAVFSAMQSFFSLFLSLSHSLEFAFLVGYGSKGLRGSQRPQNRTSLRSVVFRAFPSAPAENTRIMLLLRYLYKFIVKSI